MNPGDPITVFAFLGLGMLELVVIGFVALLVFGGRLPEVMRNLGRTYAKFRHGMSEFTDPLRDEMRRLDIRTPSSAPRSMPKDDQPPAAAIPPAPYAPAGDPSNGPTGSADDTKGDGSKAEDTASATSDSEMPDSEMPESEMPESETQGSSDSGPKISTRRHRRPSRGAADEPPPV